MKRRNAILAAALAVLCLADSTWAGPPYHPDPASLVPGLSPLSITFMDYDTDGDGIADYRIVGDYNRNGVLEWDDIQAALDTFCDPNSDGVQDAKDGKLKDLDGTGTKQAFCGTLHVLSGQWVSRTTLDPNIYNKKDDQIFLSNYQGLVFRGSGVDTTVLKAVYSRKDFCKYHYETGCGGICSRGSRGHLTISDLTFEGLDPRTWTGKGDCDGDGYQAGDTRETDYRVRTLQTAVTVWSEPSLAQNVKIINVKVAKADYNGFALGGIKNLYAANLRVDGAGSAGILFSGIQHSYATNLHVENVDGGLIEGAVSIFTSREMPGQPVPPSTHHFTIDGLVSRHNHVGLALTPQGSGGMSDITIRNFEILESRDRTGSSSPYTQFGARVNELNCLWDADRDGAIDDPCYVTNVTLDAGTIAGCPGYGFSPSMSKGGPPRNFVIRGVHFEGNGHGIGGPDSRDVDLAHVNGLIFEGNTVLGSDYNRDGVPDVNHLVRAASEGLVMRDNYIAGIVSPGGRLILVSDYRNIGIMNNTLECAAAQGSQGVFVRGEVREFRIEGNMISSADPSGVPIVSHGAGGKISGNFLKTGNFIQSSGMNVEIHSNMLLK